jgi:hypothetical protein
MYDIDPPSPILRLSAPRKAEQPTLKADAQHIARRQAPRTHIVEALADEWARREVGQKAAGKDTLIFRQDGTVLRLKAINEAHDDLARDIAAL